LPPRQKRIDQRRLSQRSGGMGGKAARFVNDQQIVIFVKDLQVHLNRIEVMRSCGFWLRCDLHAISGRQMIRGLRRFAVYEHLAGFDKLC